MYEAGCRPACMGVPAGGSAADISRGPEKAGKYILVFFRKRFLLGLRVTLPRDLESH